MSKYPGSCLSSVLREPENGINYIILRLFTSYWLGVHQFHFTWIPGFFLTFQQAYLYTYLPLHGQFPNLITNIEIITLPYKVTFPFRIEILDSRFNCLEKDILASSRRKWLNQQKWYDATLYLCLIFHACKQRKQSRKTPQSILRLPKETITSLSSLQYRLPCMENVGLSGDTLEHTAR